MNLRLIQDSINKFKDNETKYEITELKRENSYLTSKMLLATFENEHTKEALKSSSIFWYTQIYLI